MAIVEEQQFCLRWNNFQANITSQFETLRDDEDFVDVTLACDGQRFEAHKVVLSACSPFFKELFKSNPCTHPIIFMRDVDARHIVALLEFMYAGEVNVAQAHLPGFLRTAESLQIRGLTDASKVQKDNKLHKDNDNHKHNNTSENTNEHTKPSNNSTSQTNFSSYDRSRRCESPPPQSRSHTPSTQNDDIVVHHDKIKISRPIAQCSPPPPKRVCKTESLLIGDDVENSKTQFDMTLSPSSTNNSNLNNHYINQAEIHTELDLTADMIEPKTEPDYQSDGEQDHVERNLDETMLGFDGSETGNSFGVVQGTMELMPGSNMDLCQDSNQALSDSRKLHSLDPRPCHLCGRVYSNLSNLRQHMRLIHHPQTVVCPYCGKQFKTTLYMKRHLVIYHSVTSDQRAQQNSQKTATNNIVENNKSTTFQTIPNNNSANTKNNLTVSNNYQCDTNKKEFETNNVQPNSGETIIFYNSSNNNNNTETVFTCQKENVSFQQL